MKFFTGCVASTVLILVATTAAAQVPASRALRGPLVTVSDFDGPYGSPEAPPRPYGYGYGYERGWALLPATEVYAVLRDNGFSPLGIPHLRGIVYTIAVLDPHGDDGRLVIDARDGRILRFVPAYGSPFGEGPASDDERAVEPYGPQGALPPPTVIRGGPPRPPAPIPHVASRTVPIPRAAPPRGDMPAAAAGPIAPETAPQQSAAAPPKPAEAMAAVPTVGQAKPAPTILPTEDMPPVQGLE